MKFLIPFIFAVTSLIADQNKLHELWWQQCLGSKVSWATFAEWLGGIDSPSRVAMRNYVKKQGYETLLDIPCGLCTDYWGLMQDGIPIKYTGVDITPKIITHAMKFGIPVVLGSIEKIPYQDDSFDIAYARHILEHLDSYETAVNELIRVGKKEILITFFIKPVAGMNDGVSSSRDRGCLLFHNQYSQPKMEQFIKNHPKVAQIVWEDVNSKEVMLHIYLKQ